MIRLPRPLWIGVAAVVLTVAAVGVQIALPAYRKKVAIREIRRAGGMILFEERGPKWLRKRVGNEMLEPLWKITEVIFGSGQTATDEGLKHVGSLREFQKLDLEGQQKITDAGIENLKGLNIISLNLGKTQVTDAGLKSVTEMTRLLELILDETKITDSQLDSLTKLTHLSVLNLQGSQVTDAGVKKLTGLSALRSINLRGTKVTDAGVEELKSSHPGLRVRR
jgi:Leucine-rich repeat (LRR) protein